MLRSSVKIALCGLICTLALVGCSSTRPLLPGKTSNQNSANIKIKADPYVEYKIRGVIEKSMLLYSINPNKYNINIEIKEYTASVVYTEKQVAKEQARIVAKIEVYDIDYNKLADKNVEAFTTYEVCDELPHAVQASRKQATNTVLDELAYSITMAIMSVLKGK
jgi:hypothetical protein